MSKLSYQEYVDKILDKFADDITDHVFFMLQGDKELMREYYGFVADGTDTHTLNCELGRLLKSRLKLDNVRRLKEN